MNIMVGADLSSWAVGVGWRGRWLKRIKYYPFIMIHLLCFSITFEWNKDEWDKNNPRQKVK